jgi:hypothetical protein
MAPLSSTLRANIERLDELGKLMVADAFNWDPSCEWARNDVGKYVTSKMIYHLQRVNIAAGIERGFVERDLDRTAPGLPWGSSSTRARSTKNSSHRRDRDTRLATYPALRMCSTSAQTRNTLWFPAMV